jgi:outer membrane protein assembly factor BamB
LAFFTSWLCAAQGWQQWGQNPRHTGASPAQGQRLERLITQFDYDPLADPIRRDYGGSLLVHYMTPLIDNGEVFIMDRGASQWKSCASNLPPCGSATWGQMEWGVTKLLSTGEVQWQVMTSWKPAPDSGTAWEPVFHPALSAEHLYAPGEAGTVMKFDRATGELVDCLSPFDDRDASRFVTSPLTIDAAGSLYYTVMTFDGSAPWTRDVREAWLVKIDPSARTASKVSFASLIPDAPAEQCAQTFASQPLPWPPSPDAKPPVGPCGSQRPGLNSAPAIAADGTIYVVSRAHFNPAYSYLVAVNADFTTKWAASLRDKLNDGCDVLLPPSGTIGGCREGSLRGVDPATNDLPAGRVIDQSTSSPVIAPDGSVLYGAFTRYNYSRGHLFRFSADGDFLHSYDFGWDITPAISEHDGTWSVIVKDNFYPVGSYCGVVGQCGLGEGWYAITSLNTELQPEWRFENKNDQACERLADGSVICRQVSEKFEWCVNMVAVDRDGVIYANSEDGNVYAIDRSGNVVGRIFLKLAVGAAYTPLAIGPDGLIYTQNDGSLFIIGNY